MKIPETARRLTVALPASVDWPSGTAAPLPCRRVARAASVAVAAGNGKLATWRLAVADIAAWP